MFQISTRTKNDEVPTGLRRTFYVEFLPTTTAEPAPCPERRVRGGIHEARGGHGMRPTFLYTPEVLTLCILCLDQI